MKQTLLIIAVVVLVGCGDGGKKVEEAQIPPQNEGAELLAEIKAKAESGDAQSQLHLGVIYAGYVVTNEDGSTDWLGTMIKLPPKDSEEAVKWFRKCAAQGLPNGQYCLGEAYRWGEGVEEDLKEAANWHRKSAEQGIMTSQRILGLMYEMGEGVLENDKEAVKWYRLAAEQGYHPAQRNLGLMYDKGKGVEPDSVMAYAWLNIAAFNGNTLAKEYKESFGLSNKGKEKAQELSREIQKQIEARKSAKPAPRSSITPPLIDSQTGLPISESGN